MLLLVSALLIGVALGLRHNVFILVPATIVSSLSAMVLVGIASHDSVWTIAFVTIATVVILQTGYLIGTVIVLFTAERQNIASIPKAPMENAHDGASVVYLHNYGPAKTR